MEKSNDELTFEALDEISALDGTGVKEYDFVDENISNGLTYYRLKQVDLDGRFSYSRIVWVDRKLSKEQSIYPNPTHNFITISGKLGRRGRMQKYL